MTEVADCRPHAQHSSQLDTPHSATAPLHNNSSLNTSNGQYSLKVLRNKLPSEHLSNDSKYHCSGLEQKSCRSSESESVAFVASPCPSSCSSAEVAGSNHYRKVIPTSAASLTNCENLYYPDCDLKYTRSRSSSNNTVESRDVAHLSKDLMSVFEKKRENTGSITVSALFDVANECGGSVSVGSIPAPAQTPSTFVSDSPQKFQNNLKITSVKSDDSIHSGAVSQENSSKIVKPVPPLLELSIPPVQISSGFNSVLSPSNETLAFPLECDVNSLFHAPKVAPSSELLSSQESVIDKKTNDSANGDHKLYSETPAFETPSDFNSVNYQSFTVSTSHSELNTPSVLSAIPSSFGQSLIPMSPQSTSFGQTFISDQHPSQTFTQSVISAPLSSGMSYSQSYNSLPCTSYSQSSSLVSQPLSCSSYNQPLVTVPLPISSGYNNSSMVSLPLSSTSYSQPILSGSYNQVLCSQPLGVPSIVSQPLSSSSYSRNLAPLPHTGVMPGSAHLRTAADTSVHPNMFAPPTYALVSSQAMPAMTSVNHPTSSLQQYPVASRLAAPVMGPPSLIAGPAGLQMATLQSPYQVSNYP